MINKLKYWLLMKLIEDESLLNYLYIQQFIQHPIHYDPLKKYKLMVELNER